MNVTSVNILNNPGHFTQPLQFEIQYECNTNLQHGEFRSPREPSSPVPVAVMLTIDAQFLSAVTLNLVASKDCGTAGADGRCLQIPMLTLRC